MDAQRIVAANASAHALGVKPGLKRATALALAPQLVLGRADRERDGRALEPVAHAALAFTPTVVVPPAKRADAAPHTVLLEVAASLRYFGGARSCCNACRPRSRRSAIACTWRRAHRAGRRAAGAGAAAQRIAPISRRWPSRSTPRRCGCSARAASTGMRCRAWACARSATCAACRARALRAASAMRCCSSSIVRSASSPIRARRSRCRLPSRAASSCSRAPTAPSRCCTAPACCSTGWCCGWGAARLPAPLHARDAARDALARAQRHAARHVPRARARRALARSRAPDRAAARAARRLCCPRHARPRAAGRRRRAARRPEQRAVRTAQGAHEGLMQLIERLQARLGPEHVQRLEPVQDHRPERLRAWFGRRGRRRTGACDAGRLPAGKAARKAPAMPPRRSKKAAAAATAPAAVNPRSAARPGRPPCARRRRVRCGCCRSPSLCRSGRSSAARRRAAASLSGPERIEAGWWDTALAERDYFIAQAADGALVWIYRARLPLSVAGRRARLVHARPVRLSATCIVRHCNGRSDAQPWADARRRFAAAVGLRPTALRCSRRGGERRTRPRAAAVLLRKPAALGAQTGGARRVALGRRATPTALRSSTPQRRAAGHPPTTGRSNARCVRRRRRSLLLAKPRPGVGRCASAAARSAAACGGSDRRKARRRAPPV